MGDTPGGISQGMPGGIPLGIPGGNPGGIPRGIPRGIHYPTKPHQTLSYLTSPRLQ